MLEFFHIYICLSDIYPFLELLLMLAIFLGIPILFWDKENLSIKYYIPLFWFIHFPMILAFFGIVTFLSGPILAILGVFKLQFIYVTFLYLYTLFISIVWIKLSKKNRVKTTLYF